FDVPYDHVVVDAPPPMASAEPVVRLRIPTPNIGALLEPLVRWSVRFGALAAVLAVVVGAGWFARPYWATARAYFTKLTVTAKTGTAVLESAPPGSEVLIDGAAA